ncbi:PIN domain-containing protein [Moorena producens JHB]|uniref:PIN domain-containing protein n=1 Tax=Moorena producens (strain JHB) TaxID=1454205 RepID=A0A1D9G348_MOOP1|nr:PIN domain-containing protein [Moorena producens]AOY82046.1 PIN domain-containing protein [Moorena producens JHB]
MNCLFLDTSYMIALELADDQNHQITLNHWQNLDKTNLKLVTTSYVFDELVTFLNSRYLHSKAVEIGKRLLTSSVVDLIQVNEVLFLEGWDYFQKYQDKSYSLTDCLSFVVMNKLKINVALTFDQHFVQAGFIKLP